MAALDRVKVLVLGDSGVGKSSLVHLLCQNQVLGNPSWTVGCSVDVRIHDYKEGTPEEKTYYIELWDVGGSVGSATSVKSTRAVFYNLLNGIILVHDLTNKKSSQNLYRWSLEALNRDVAPTGVLVTNGDYDREQFADNQIPLLVIGTKLDQIPEMKRNEVLTRTAFLAEDFNAEEINLDCTNPRYLAAGSSNAVKLSRFFDKVIEKRYFLRDGNQPSQFEQCIVYSLQSLKTVLDCKPGEASVFQQQKTQEDVCQLSIGIMQVFIDCLEQLSTKPDGDIDTAHLSVDVSSPDLFGSIHEDSSLSSEQRLLIALSNCRYLERHTFLNIAEHFEKHGFQGVEKITQVSMESLKELDQRLFEMYIEAKADPIVGSLEPGIYAGYFDWKDCLVPAGVRNYLKEALVNIIAVHAEVFTISKDLVPRVMSRIVEAVSEELSRLMQCVSFFSKNGALQARLEICALRDTVAIYLTPESNSSFKQALEALPQLSSGTDKKLLEELLNKFKSNMHLQLTCFQASSSAMMKT